MQIGRMLIACVLSFLLLACWSGCGDSLGPPVACGGDTCSGDEHCVQESCCVKDGGGNCDQASQPKWCARLTPDKASWAPVRLARVACPAAYPISTSSRAGGCLCT
jgi:hypothetical protein